MHCKMPDWMDGCPRVVVVGLYQTLQEKYDSIR